MVSKLISAKQLHRLEPWLLLLFFFIFAGHFTPSVNEAHYLCKARHYWDPSWCPNDQFMCSADTHLAFYWAFGWLTKYCSLTTTAWIGRFILWGALAYVWTRLSRAVNDTPGFAVLTGALATTLVEITNMAGEWFVGGVEGKVFAWALALLAAHHVLRNEWVPVWPMVGIATAFHALVGGYSWLIFAMVYLFDTSNTQRLDRATPGQQIPAILVGFAAALVGVVPAILMDWQVDPQTAMEAHAIQVHERIPHHLKLASMKWYRQLRFAVLVGIWLTLAAPVVSPILQRLKLIVNGSLVISGIGALIELFNWFTDGAAVSWQRYYWFRMSDIWVPLGLTLLVAARVAQLTPVSHRGRQRALVVALVWLTIWVPTRYIYLHIDRRPHAVRQARPFRMRQRRRHNARYRDWRSLCLWIDEHTARDATFLTPITRQTFKWFANRGELATWKGMPQNATAIVEWKRRRTTIAETSFHSDETPVDVEALMEVAQTYGLTHIVVEKGRSRLSPSLFPLLYRNDHFQLYRIPGATTKTKGQQ